MNKNEVNTAFEILLEEIEEVFNILSKICDIILNETN